MTLHSILLKFLGEVTQFHDGFSVLSVHESMKKNPMPYFCSIETDVLSLGMYVASIIRVIRIVKVNLCVLLQISSETYLQVFTERFIKSHKGGKSFMHFIDYLDDREGGKAPLTIVYFNANYSWFLSFNALTEEMMHQDVDDHIGNYGKYLILYLLYNIVYII